MTHSGGQPHAVGDKGQRYEIRAIGYPRGAQSVIGWANNLEGADDMLSALCEAPGCVSVEIFDRQESKPVIKRYAGILR